MSARLLLPPSGVSSTFLNMLEVGGANSISIYDETDRVNRKALSQKPL